MYSLCLQRWVASWKIKNESNGSSRAKNYNKWVENTLDEINSRIDITEENISEHSDIIIEAK